MHNNKKSTYKKKPILIHKKCSHINCNSTSVSVHGENPYCREHTESQCCLKFTENVYNEKRCNAVCGMVEFHGKKYCNSHYRTLISSCHHPKCIKSRDTNEISHDNYWYCNNHKPDQNLFMTSIGLSLQQQHKIPIDISSKIYSLLKDHKTSI